MNTVSANTAKGRWLLYESFKKHTERVFADRQAAIEFLKGTGMYDDAGRLKDEFK